MTALSPRSSLPPISDELLSAYLDGQATAAESTRVEQARAEDADLALRLDMLEQTVNLLRQTPRLAVPRSFVLSEAQVVAAGGKVKGAAKRPGGFWAWLGGLSPRTMPLATAAVALALLLVIGIDMGGSQSSTPAAAPAAAVTAETAAAEPMAMSAESAAGEAAPAAEENMEMRAMTTEATPVAEPTVAAKMAPAPDEIASAQVQSEDAAALQAVIAEEQAAPPATPSFRLLELALAALLLLLVALTVLSRSRRTA